VVVTDMCNLPEIGEVGAGYVVTTTAAQIADAIRRLFSLPLESRRAMGGNARSLAARFTWKRIAGQTIACYETMIAKNSARIDARWR
jgi:glycosyltransferase involved in cell wall biosynthesis